MRAIEAISHGARTVNRAKRLILVLWVFLILIAGVAATPAAAVIARSLGHSKWAEELIRGLDPSWIMESVLDSRGYPAATLPVAFGLALAMALIGHILIAGGAISVFTSEDRRYTAARFFEGCGRYFWRFFRLFVASLILCGIVLAINAGIKALETKLWGEGMVETPIFYSDRVRIALVVFLFVVVGMVIDYAKIRLVVEPGRSAIRALLWSVRFVARNFGRCLRIWIVLILFGVLFYLAYDRLSAFLPQTTLGGVLALLAIQQLYIVSRLWLRLTFWASQAEMYFGLKPQEETPVEPVRVYAWPPEAPSDPMSSADTPLPQADEEAAGPA